MPSSHRVTRPEMDSTLETARLELRTFDLDDLTQLHTIFSDAQTHTFSSGAVSDIAETRNWIERRAVRRRDHGVAWYGIRLKGDPRLIGSTGLFIGRTGAEPELGMEIRFEDQRNGYATEAAAAVLHQAFASGFTVVWATVRAWNIASRTVLDRLGFTYDHTDGEGDDALIYLRSRPSTDR